MLITTMDPIQPFQSSTTGRAFHTISSSHQGAQLMDITEVGEWGQQPYTEIA